MDTSTPGGSYTPPPPPPTGGPAGGGGDLVYPPQPPKDPILILVLNLLLLGGVGYIVMGQKMKGIVAIIASLVIGIPTCGIGWGLVCIFGAIDGYIQAPPHPPGLPLTQCPFFNHP